MEEGWEAVVEEEGAGLKEEEVELAGEGSTDEGESMQRAESRDVVELLRFVLRVFIQACSRHCWADMRFLSDRKYQYCNQEVKDSGLLQVWPPLGPVRVS